MFPPHRGHTLALEPRRLRRRGLKPQEEGITVGRAGVSSVFPARGLTVPRTRFGLTRLNLARSCCRVQPVQLTICTSHRTSQELS